MNLVDFDKDEIIFVDANIFVYHIDRLSKHSQTCSKFLSKIEHQKIKATTSCLVIDEVIYALLLLKASECLPGKRLKEIKKRLETDTKLIKDSYNFVQQILDYIEVLRLGGFSIQSVNFEIIREVCSVGREYALYPRDTIHLLTCQTFGIHHIATTDSHFQKVPFLNVWSP